MTTYGAYDRDLPCKNTSCKSYGQPHPNCECYSHLSSGGEISHFCNNPQAHQPDCQYFADGAIVQANMLRPQELEDPNHAVAGYLARNGLPGLLNLDTKDYPKYQMSVNSGHKSIENYAKALFQGKPIPKMDHSKAKKDIDKWMEKGGISGDIQDAFYNQNPSQNFAEGGEVKEDPLDAGMIAQVHPAQNTLLQMAKGRISNYLNAQRPQENLPKLAFDSEPDQTEQKKTYARARDLAIHPLGVLEHVSRGTLEPEHVKHLSAMYPELNDSLQKKLTQHITDGQLKGTKPTHKVQQGLSLLMGTNLTSDLSPQNIMAAQATFQPMPSAQQPPAKPVTKNKKNTSTLSKSSQSFLTGNQALASRQQKQQ